MSTFHLFTIAVTSTTVFIFTQDINAFDPLLAAIQEYQGPNAHVTPPGTEIAVIQPPVATDVAVITPVNTDVATIQPVVNDVTVTQPVVNDVAVVRPDVTVVRPVILDVVISESPHSIEPAIASSQLQPSAGIQNPEPAIASSQLQPSAGFQSREFNSQVLTSRLSVQSAPGILEDYIDHNDPSYRNHVNTNARRIEFTREN